MYNISLNNYTEFNLPFLHENERYPCIPLTQSNQTKISCLANIISPGIMKSGTSFLYYTLVTHPSIQISKKKEADFYFNSKIGPYNRGIVGYSLNFAQNTDNSLFIDVSPHYAMYPDSPSLIYQTNRFAKFIFILRDPVDRTYSHYNYEEDLRYRPNHINKTLSSSCPRRREELSFKHYISEEWNALKQCNMIDWNPNPPSWLYDIPMPLNCTLWNCTKFFDNCKTCFPISNTHLTHATTSAYLTNSIYYSKIEEYFKYFPRENFYFVRFEDIEEQGFNIVFNNICKWLGLDILTKDQWGEEKENGKNTGKYNPIKHDEDLFLRQFFKEPNKRLEKLLGRSFNWKT